MSKVKNHRMGQVALCVLAAFALTAFVASAAQAAPPEWMLNGANVSSNTTVDATLTPELIEFQNGAGTDMVNAALLLSETAIGAPIWISCKAASGTGIILQAGGTATGTVEFKECSTSLLNGSKQMTLSAVCAPKQPIKAAGKVSLVLQGGAEFAKLEGTGGGNFATIEFPNEECTLFGSKFNVAGWVLVKDCKGLFNKEELSHLIEEDMTATLAAGGGLTFGAKNAKVDGSGILEVFQSGVMKTFSGLA